MHGSKPKDKANKDIMTSQTQEAHVKEYRWDYLVRLVDLMVVWDGEAVILIQNHCPDVDLLAAPGECLVERDGEVIESRDSGVGEAQRRVGEQLEDVERRRQV